MRLQHEGHSMYEEAVSFRRLMEAARQCSKNVSWKSSVIRWMFEKEQRCQELQSRLKSGRYKISKYVNSITP